MPRRRTPLAKAKATGQDKIMRAVSKTVANHNQKDRSAKRSLMRCCGSITHIVHWSGLRPKFAGS